MATEGTAGAGQSSGANGVGGSDRGVDKGTEDRVSAAMERGRSSRSDDDGGSDGGGGRSASSSTSNSSPGAGEGSMDAAAAGARGAGGDEASEHAQADRRTEARRNAERGNVATAEARASQERLEAQGQAARRSYEARETARATAAAGGGTVGPDPAPDQAVERVRRAQYAVAEAGPAEVVPTGAAAPRTAVPGTYEDSYVAQAMSGVNEGIATLAGGAVDLSEMALNGALWVGERAGVPGADFRFENSFGGSGTFEAAMAWTGSINPESADPTKQALRDGAEVTTEVAGAVVGAMAAARNAGRTVGDLAERTVQTLDDAFEVRLAPPRQDLDRDRIRELGVNHEQGGIPDLREGTGAVRYEAATGRSLSPSTTTGVDFYDGGVPISLKGPLASKATGEALTITDAMVDGLARSVIKGARQNTAARDIVVDTLDLTAEQREQLTRAIGDGLAGFDDMPTRITILE